MPFDEEGIPTGGQRMISRWDEDVELHCTLAWFDTYRNGNLCRRMHGVAGSVVQSVDCYADYAPCDGGSDCDSADERLRMSHVHLSDLWCSRHAIGNDASENMKGGSCALESIALHALTHMRQPWIASDGFRPHRLREFL